MHKESCLVVVSFPTKFTFRMTLRSILIALPKVIFIIWLLIDFLLGRKGLFVLDAQLAHLHIVFCLVVLLELLHITSSLFAYSTFECPQCFDLWDVISFLEEHLGFLIIDIIWTNVIAPDGEVRELSSNFIRADHMIELLFTGCAREVSLNGAQP